MHLLPARIALLCLLTFPLLASADVFTLGSSYTWDARPNELDDAPQWHIECGKSLIYIHDNPFNPCVSSSTLWPDALAATIFDYITFQPVPEENLPDSKLRDDLFSIYDFLRKQPNATIVVHQTWPIPSQWEAALHGPSDLMMTNRSLAYGYAVKRRLEDMFPEYTVRLTRSNEMLDRIYHDCQKGACPFPQGFQAMFRDAQGHMSFDAGSYLQHNALRAALGQPIGVDSPSAEYKVIPSAKAYLDGVIAQHLPEPGPAPSLGVGAILVAGLAKRRIGARSPR
jgi:hypothetical protein